MQFFDELFDFRSVDSCHHFYIAYRAVGCILQVRQTSHKPDEIYGVIERLAPGTRKIGEYLLPSHHHFKGQISCFILTSRRIKISPASGAGNTFAVCSEHTVLSITNKKIKMISR